MTPSTVPAAVVVARPSSKQSNRNLRVPDGLVPSSPPPARQPARPLLGSVHHELLREAADEALALLGPGLRSLRLVHIQVVSDRFVDAARVAS